MGIVVSTNGGTNWTPIRISAVSGTESTVAAVAPGNASIFYVGGRTSSYKALVYKSTNRGADWTAITNGISNPPLAIAVDPQGSNIVFVVTNDAVWRSSNGGTSWTKCTFPVNSWGFLAVAINKNNPSQVFVGTCKGVFYSQDRGLTWTDVSQGLSVPWVTQLYFNSANSTLYVGTEGGGLWKRKF
ncbi:MAG: hypothetical protein MUQ00_01065 [Candidatus Aminicenantes bacterium]|nr:hypothetical protein [Candidatus Aminicenantes bacterium]